MTDKETKEAKAEQKQQDVRSASSQEDQKDDKKASTTAPQPSFNPNPHPVLNRNINSYGLERRRQISSTCKRRIPSSFRLLQLLLWIFLHGSVRRERTANGLLSICTRYNVDIPKLALWISSTRTRQAGRVWKRNQADVSQTRDWQRPYYF